MLDDYRRLAELPIAGLALGRSSVFGSAAVGLFWQTLPRVWAGVLRAAILLAVLLLPGGLVAPMITRAFNRR